MGNGNKITTPGEHRALLFSAIEAVCEGRLSVPQANAVSDLSAEVHKSLRQEWDMRVYAAENLTLEHGKVVKMLGSSDDDS
jgi:hypothetical protein